jgi:hypothetical protein
MGIGLRASHCIRMGVWGCEYFIADSHRPALLIIHFLVLQQHSKNQV